MTLKSVKRDQMKGNYETDWADIEGSKLRVEPIENWRVEKTKRGFFWLDAREENEEEVMWKKKKEEEGKIERGKEWKGGNNSR